MAKCELVLLVVLSLVHPASSQLCRWEKIIGHRSTSGFNGFTYYLEKCGEVCVNSRPSCMGVNWRNDGGLPNDRCNISTSNVLVEDDQYDHYVPKCSCKWKKFPSRFMRGGRGITTGTVHLCAEKCARTLGCQGFDWSREKWHKCYLLFNITDQIVTSTADHYELLCGNMSWTISHNEEGTSMNMQHGLITLEACKEACLVDPDCQHGISWDSLVKKCAFNRSHAIKFNFEGVAVYNYI